MPERYLDIPTNNWVINSTYLTVWLTDQKRNEKKIENSLKIIT